MTEMRYVRRRRFGCLPLVLIVLGVVIAFWILPPPPEDSRLARWWPARATTVPAAGEDEYPDLDEVWSGGTGTNKVIRIPLTGMILLDDAESGFFSGGHSANQALRGIRRATRDPAVRAIILEVDSGGGGITASDILYHALLAFKAADPERRIVSLCGDMAASGAYYVALASDCILAHPTTITGSIGVIIRGINIRELAKRHGIADMTFKSGEHKDLLNPLGEVSGPERDILQSVVNDMHRRFSDLVAERRGIPAADLDALADGRIFTAGTALENRLIDGIGYWDDAVRRTEQLLGVSDVIIYRYAESFSWQALLRVAGSLHPRAWFRDAAPRLQYRIP